MIEQSMKVGCLAIALGLTEITRADDAQTFPVEAREGKVYAASYIKGPTLCDGKTHPVDIRIDPNPTQVIQIGFFESSAGAVGPQWRTAGWMAALVATTLLKEDLHNYRLSFTLEGRIDGPSAGALTTSGLIALMRGDRIPATVSMTGTINPDGTVGPVGGIPQKVRGAAKSGKKRFAIPLGQRRDINLCTGNEEDVVALGNSLGIEVQEVGDVREAYSFLTGTPLPAVPEKTLSWDLPKDIRKAYRDLFDVWWKRYKDAEKIIAEARQGELTPEYQSIWRLGQHLADSGQEELRLGHEAAAFNRVWMAVLNAEVAAQGVLGVRVLLTQGFPGIHSYVRGQLDEARLKVESTIRALRNTSVASTVDAGVVAWIGIHLAPALAYLAQGESLLSRSVTLSRKATPKDFPEIGLLAFQALLQTTLTEALAESALATRGWLGRGGPSLPKGAAAERKFVSDLTLYQSAARSNVGYFDALITAERAKRKHVDLETEQAALLRNDLVYLGAQGALEHAGAVSKVFTELQAQVFGQLGALFASVSNSSLLVAQHYSLGAKTDKLGRVVGFATEAPVARMIDLADQEAVRAIGEADSATNGVSTPMLISALDTARRNRDNSVSAQDRLTALSLYWNTTLTARLISQLSQQHW
ncbi:MAG: hypothetical protein KDJ70_01085 [Candidatus Competibacteraceae bacterium]|nr:hypothetical protein [Candidatus Competibacteraceae bacterium]